MAIDYARLKAWPFPDVKQSYTAEDAILYALGIGLGRDPTNADELRFLYEDGLAVLPTFAVVLGYPAAGCEIPEPASIGSRSCTASRSLCCTGRSRRRAKWPDALASTRSSTRVPARGR